MLSDWGFAPNSVAQSREKNGEEGGKKKNSAPPEKNHREKKRGGCRGKKGVAHAWEV